MLSKRIVICCDGTWQDLSNERQTNVVKIAQAIKPSDREGRQQIVSYHSGIGVLDLYDRILGGTFGWGIDRHIQDAYRFLCLNYNDGDEVYLFGFSRGAYTVRSLAGLIYKSGLLTRKNISKAREAYEFYRNLDKPRSEAAIAFRQKLDAKQIPIRLLACWDTVGALGIPNTIPVISKIINRQYEFHDTQLNRKIERALHAVAIDEHRKSFEVTPMHLSDNAETQLSQVWFVGNHGCVGGGQANQGLSDIPLQWMMNEIDRLQLGLEFFEGEALKSVIRDFAPDVLTGFTPPTSLLYRLTALAGLRDRTLLKSPAEDPTLFFAKNIHQSVKLRWAKELNPPRNSKNLKPFQRDFERFDEKFDS
ncbi:MAG: DUF2235 domain-containing protein [Leptolyngbya sp. Prado105]|jgi:uncharacterized protein (DUF2235 family)|nr:DUF2235 domain-containing protein [Leptolyngbya sp. Prado105]